MGLLNDARGEQLVTTVTVLAEIACRTRRDECQGSALSPPRDSGAVQ